MDATIVARSSSRLRAGWERGSAAFGVWSSIPDTSVAELVAGSPFDYVCVDLQHGVPTFTELPVMLQVMRAAGRAPIVRVPWNDPAAIMRALDTGACGVLVPMVNSAADAARAVAACRYPPAGQRSWGPMWGYTRTDGVPSPAEQDASMLCIVMVETQAGVDELEQIVRVPGVDAIYIGPNDLALNCGYGRATYRDSPEVDKLLEHIVATCEAAGTVVGLHCSDPEMGTHWVGRGARMVTVAQDTGLLQAALDATWAQARSSD
jgi:4-hydroxy-2-oxoheptanedioate aldolase